MNVSTSSLDATPSNRETWSNTGKFATCADVAELETSKKKDGDEEVEDRLHMLPLEAQRLHRRRRSSVEIESSLNRPAGSL